MRQFIKFLTVAVLAIFVVSCVKLSAFEELQLEFDALKIQVATSATAQEDTSALLESLQEQLSALSLQVEDNSTDITENSEGVADNLTLIQSIYAELQEADVENLDVVTALVAQNLSDVTTYIDGQVSDLDLLISERIELNNETINQNLIDIQDDLNAQVQNGLATAEDITNDLRAHIDLLLSTLDDIQAANAALIADVNVTVDGLGDRINILEASNTSISSLQALVGTIENDLDALTATISGTTVDLTPINTRLDALESINYVEQTEFDQFSGEIQQQIVSQVAVVQGALDAHITATASNTANIAQNASDIAALTQNLNDQVAALNTLIDAAEASIASNATGIASNTFNIDAIQDRVAALETNLGNLSTTVNNIDVALTNLASTVASNTSDIATNEGNVEDNANQLVTNTVAIANNLTAIGDNYSSIVSNTSDISDNSNVIVNILTDIANVRNEIASTTMSLTTAINVAQDAADVAQATADNNAAGLSATASDVLVAQATANSAVASVTALETELNGHITDYETKVAELETLIQSNADLIAENATGIASNTLDIASLQTTVGGLDTRINDAVTEIGSVSSTLDALGTTVVANHDALNAALGSVSSTISDINNNIVSLTASLTALEAAIDVNGDAITSLTASLTALDSELTIAETALSDLETRVSNVEAFEARIVDLEADITSLTASGTTATELQDAIDALKTELQTYADDNDDDTVFDSATIEASITALEAAVLQAQTDATSALTGVGSNTLLIENLQDQIDAIDATVTGLDTRITTAETTIGVVSATLSTLDSTVASNYNELVAELGTISATISTIENSIDTINGQITTLQGGVGTSSETLDLINSLTTSLTALETDLEAAETTLSTLATTVATLDTELDSLTTQVASNTLDIAALELALSATSSTTITEVTSTATGTIITFSDGAVADIPNGINGESITVSSTTINADGDTVIEFSDGTQVVISAEFQDPADQWDVTATDQGGESQGLFDVGTLVTEYSYDGGAWTTSLTIAQGEADAANTVVGTTIVDIDTRTRQEQEERFADSFDVETYTVNGFDDDTTDGFVTGSTRDINVEAVASVTATPTITTLPATVYAVVNPNLPPTWTLDGLGPWIVGNAAGGNVTFTINAVDPEGDTLTYSWETRTGGPTGHVNDPMITVNELSLGRPAVDNWRAQGLEVRVEISDGTTTVDTGWQAVEIVIQFVAPAVTSNIAAPTTAQPFVLSVPGTGPGYNTLTGWETSLDSGTTWTSIGTAGVTLSVDPWGFAQQSHFYRATITDLNGDPQTSNPIEVVISPATVVVPGFNPPVQTTDHTVNRGLGITGWTTNSNWIIESYSATLDGQPENTPIALATNSWIWDPTANGLWRIVVRGIDANGTTHFLTADVRVGPVPPPATGTVLGETTAFFNVGTAAIGVDASVLTELQPGDIISLNTQHLNRHYRVTHIRPGLLNITHVDTGTVGLVEGFGNNTEVIFISRP